MGMDLIELVSDLEDEFGIAIPSEQFPRMLTVGGVVAVVREQLRARESIKDQPPLRWKEEPGNRARLWTDEELFLRIQEAIAHVLGVEITSIRPESHLIYDLGMD